ncbi:MAG TPA: calcium/proton exchanger [Acidimicrobiales bacterium]|nr:calcium/proton exchanger [Acidimicrobiales bacterium]
MKARGYLVAVAVLVPASIAADLAHQHSATFILSALAVVPLAGLLGRATEELALSTGPQVGGLLNATFGNAAELIIGLLLVLRGELDVVRASITGSIIGNLLLVLGASFFAAGLRRKEVCFPAQAASTLVASMALAVAGILMPTIYAGAAHATDFRRESISVVVGAVLIALYAANLIFSLVTHTDTFGAEPHADEGPPTWSKRAALLGLAGAGVLVAFESDLLVGALEPTVRAWGVSKIWVGMILVPIVGNAAEHSTAVLLALRGKIDVSIAIAVGSSAQIALLVGPLLVFAGALSGNHLQLVVTPFEVTAVAVSVAVVGFLVQDGRTNWLEGVQLLGLYAILAVAGFFLGRP